MTFETAMGAATNPSDFALKMRMFNRVAGAQPAAAGAVAAPAGEPEVTGSSAFDFLNQ